MGRIDTAKCKDLMPSFAALILLFTLAHKHDLTVINLHALMSAVLIRDCPAVGQ